MRKFLLFIFIMFSGILISQNSAETETLFFKNLYTYFQDPAQTIRVANYLSENATTNSEKAKALYLLSEVSKIQGDYEESIRNLFEAKALLEEDEHFTLSIVLSAIAERCQTSGINEISENYLLQANEHNKKIAVNEEAVIAKTIVLHEKANVAFQNDDLDSASTYLEEAALLIPEVNAYQPALVAINSLLFANLYRQNKQYSSARQYYNKAISVLQASSLLNSSLEAEALLGIGTVEYLKGNFEIAEDSLLKAISIETIPKPVKAKLFKQLSQLYKEQGNTVGFQENYKESAAISSDILASERKMRNSILSEIEAEQEIIISSEKNRYYWIGGVLGAILLIVSIGYFWYDRKLAREQQKFDEILERLEKKEKIEAPKKVAERNIAGEKGVTIPQETVDAILERLNEFEASGNYTNSDISLSVLAKQLQTNTKYISEIIHVHKNKNFNTYINELRINHIMQLMKEDEKYLHYKVSYLAEESGFSSHSAFTVVFKSIAGITPKQFISFLRKEEKVAS